MFLYHHIVVLLLLCLVRRTCYVVMNLRIEENKQKTHAMIIMNKETARQKLIIR